MCLFMFDHLKDHAIHLTMGMQQTRQFKELKPYEGMGKIMLMATYFICAA